MQFNSKNQFFMTTLRCIFFLLVPLLFSYNSIAQNKSVLNLGDVVLNKYSFVIFGVNNPTDVEQVVQTLLLNEGILLAKSDFPEITFTVVTIQKINTAFISNICNKLNNKTDKFKTDIIKVTEFLNQYAFDQDSFQQKCNTGNKELDKYIETVLQKKLTKK